ncbi:hypothetical protein [Desulfocastanea catecholica]
MTKQTVLPILIILQLLCWASLLSAQDLSTHRAYKVTSYNLGAFQSFQNTGDGRAAGNFKPLLITGGTVDILNSEHQKSVSLSGQSETSGLSGIALSGEIDATDHISIQGTFGVTRNLWSPDLMGGVNGSSWEANLGVVYKLLNNISYELHFGYMDTGTLFTNRNSYSDVENIIMISNQLTLSF